MTSSIRYVFEECPCVKALVGVIIGLIGSESVCFRVLQYQRHRLTASAGRLGIGMIVNENVPTIVVYTVLCYSAITWKNILRLGCLFSILLYEVCARACALNSFTV